MESKTIKIEGWRQNRMIKNIKIENIKRQDGIKDGKKK